MDLLARDKLVIAARRLFARSKITLAVSLERKLVAESLTRDSLIEEIKRAAGLELVKASNAIAPAQLEADFNSELSEIEGVITSRDISKALRLLPAKELIGRLSPRTGCKNGTDLMRSLGRNLKPSEFSELSALASMIAPPKPI